MAVRRGGDRPAVLLDWFTVSYRSIVGGSIALILLLSAVGGALYYQFVYRNSPRARASTSITQAEGLLEKASAGEATKESEPLKQNAERLLGEARRQFDATNFEDAAKSAEQSQMSSQRVIALAHGETSRAAQFYKIEGDVKVKRSRELIWAPAAKGMTLSVGDQIKTDSRSAAQIIYFNGTITTVTPGSLLEIKELYENPTTRVQQVRERLHEGRVSSSTQDPPTKGSFHEIATQNTVATTEERTEMDVAFDDRQATTRLEVHTGKASVSTPEEGARKIAVEAQERVEVDQKERLSTKVKLPAAPLLNSPVDQRILPLEGGEGGSVQLEWQEVAEAKSYHLQISAHPLFSDSLVDRTLDTTSATLPRAGEGNYYWRVAAIFDDGTEGPMSEARKFKIVPGTLAPSGDVQPPPLEIDDFLTFATQVIVRGKTEPGAQLSVDGAKIDVYDDGTFTSVIPLRKAGHHTLVFVAQDVAGNATRLERVVDVDTY
ncbi:MAG: FecR domain-containing protein [Acidobacteria bacterium]|nr:FecR domain-containing protein [Acidobacteriota bacterium]